MESLEAWKDQVLRAAEKIDASYDLTNDQVLRAIYAELVKLQAENRALHERTRGLAWFAIAIGAGIAGFLWRVHAAG